MNSYTDFAYVYDLMMQDLSYRDRAAHFDALIQQHTKKRGILLDLACGTGSLSEKLDALGYDVIGVDVSEDMLAVAMQKKFASGSGITYLCQTMQELDLYGTVDAAVCALDSINHITDPAQLQLAFDRVSLFLDPDGVFLFDVNTIYKHREVLSDQVFVYDYDEVYLVWQNHLMEEDVVEIHLDIFERTSHGYERFEETFCERAYSDGELRAMLKRAGLSVAACYADDTYNAPAQDTQRLLYVTKKEKTKGCRT